MIEGSDEHQQGSNWKNLWTAATEEIVSTNPAVQVSIAKAEQAGSMLTRYVVYLLHTEPFGHNVKRRWSEFLWLRDTLGKAFPGMFIPVLPTNSVFTGATDVEGELVRSRIVLLTTFMAELFSIPFLLGEPIIMNFLSMDEKDFKVFQESLSKTVVADVSSPGAVAWRNLLDNNAAAVVAENYFEDMKRYLDSLKTSFTALSEQTAACAKNSQLLYTEMTNATSAFGVWADAECSTSELPAEANCLRPQHIKRLSDALVVSSGHWTVSTHSYIKIHTTVNGIIQNQLAQIEGFRDHLKGKESLQQLLEKTEKERAKLLEDKSKATASAASAPSGGGFGRNLFSKGSVDTLNEAYNKKDELVMLLADQLMRFSKALNICEIERFQSQRSQILSKLLGIMIAANIQAQERSVARWVEISSLAAVDYSEYQSDVQQILEPEGQTVSSSAAVVAPARIFGSRSAAKK